MGVYVENHVDKFLEKKLVKQVTTFLASLKFGAQYYVVLIFTQVGYRKLKCSTVEIGYFTKVQIIAHPDEYIVELNTHQSNQGIYPGRFWVIILNWTDIAANVHGNVLITTRIDSHIEASVQFDVTALAVENDSWLQLDTISGWQVGTELGCIAGIQSVVRLRRFWIGAMVKGNRRFIKMVYGSTKEESHF